MQILDLRSSKKTCSSSKVVYLLHVLKNIKQQCKNNKLTIIAWMWNDEFELHGTFYSVSAIEDYIEYIIKNMKHYPVIHLIIFASTGLIID